MLEFPGVVGTTVNGSKHPLKGGEKRRLTDCDFFLRIQASAAAQPDAVAVRLPDGVVILTNAPIDRAVYRPQCVHNASPGHVTCSSGTVASAGKGRLRVLGRSNVASNFWTVEPN